LGGVELIASLDEENAEDSRSDADEPLGIGKFLRELR